MNTRHGASLVSTQALGNFTDNVIVCPEAVGRNKTGLLMTHVNQFKKSMKAWTQEHPDADEEQFMDFCESQIAPELYATHGWLVDQARDWFRHVESCRKTYYCSSQFDDANEH